MYEKGILALYRPYASNSLLSALIPKELLAMSAIGFMFGMLAFAIASSVNPCGSSPTLTVV